ncbi:hypothetical protein NG701_05195 [Pseudarthrobacter sp. HLT3-5]|nr:hypothetical protein [Pseudarthrobacter sp. HLT3-5]MCO4273830.1 hypothetical protein [Pseudarthrobacter sp. HLT3-5]
MELTGTIQMADGSIDHITAQGDDYDNAKAALEAAIPEGSKLIAIRKGS